MLNSKEQVIRSNCRGCHGGCGVLVYVKDNTIVKIEGDPDFPTNHGTMCSKGLAFKQLVYHPDRLKYPLKRAGEKGEGRWERISCLSHCIYAGAPTEIAQKIGQSRTWLWYKDKV